MAQDILMIFGIIYRALFAIFDILQCLQCSNIFAIFCNVCNVWQFLQYLTGILLFDLAGINDYILFYK